MIYVGVDDTDMPGTPGTNQIAKALAAELAGRYECTLIVRHQLWQDACVPYTSKNSAASLHLRPQGDGSLEWLIDRSRGLLRSRFVEGSDPGLCVATRVPEPIEVFGGRCQRGLATQREARRLADEHGLYLEGLGGTEDGVIGALAAVGLAAGGDDGRVVQIGRFSDDLADRQDLAALRARNVEVRCVESGRVVHGGSVDVGKHLRPNYRRKKIVLFARRASGGANGAGHWQAVRFT